MRHEVRTLIVKTISKTVVWIILLIMVFIFSNMIIWSFKIKSFSTYIHLLNNKDWSKTISQVTLTNPTSMFYIFGVGHSKIGLKTGDVVDVDNTNIDLQQIVDTGDYIEVVNTGDEDSDKTGEELDPYDPSFEDEFNSFFGGEASSGYDNTGAEIQSDTGDDILDATDEDDNTHAVAKALLKKFNE